MIKKVVITNMNGEKLTINLNDVEPSSGLFISEIQGLGPVKAAINMTDFATQDGAKYNSARAEKRNIVLSVIYTDTDAENARLLTYKYFPLKQPVTFYIQTGNREAEVTGYIESNEPDIFEERANAQISIVCDSSYFKDVSDGGIQEIPFSNITSLFEFEFWDENSESPTIEFSSLEVKRENIIRYDGETETGMLISIYALDHFRNPTVYNNKTLEKFSIDTDKVEAIIGSPIAEGDEIQISTVKNDKWIHFIREGRTWNILNALSKDADWFTVYPGNNIFSYTAEEGELNFEFKITVQILLQGV